MEQGGGHTGWSRAWVACLYSRLGEGEKMYEHIYKMICEFATASFLDTHPLSFPDQPLIFQIDGNLGAVAAMTEGIAQYKDEKLYLLPALPERWKSGEISGLKTPGGHSVSFKWCNGKVCESSVKLGFENKLKTVISGKEHLFTGKQNEIIIWRDISGGKTDLERI